MLYKEYWKEIRDMKKRLNRIQINNLVKDIGFSLPQDYIAYLNKLEEFEVESNYNYINFWPLSDLKEFNDECESQIYIPNYYILGTDGGGTALALNKSTHELFFTEMIGMNETDIWKIASSFSHFMSRFEKEVIEI